MIKQTQKLHQNKNSYFHRIRVSVSMLLVCLLSAMTWLIIPLPAHAVARTWDGGCGANTNWSCANNWSGDTVPASGDTLTFNATSTNNSTVDALFNATETISSLTIAAGYTGTITLATTLHISGNYSQATGTFTAAAQTFDMNGSFTLSGGIFTASSSSTTLAGAMTISGVPTFNNNSGVFTFDGTTTASLSCNNVVFNSVLFTHTTGTKTVGSNCSMPLGNNPTVSVAVTVNGTLSGTGTLSTTSGTLLIGTTGVLSGFSGIDTGSNLSINGTVNAGSYSTFSVTGSFVLGATAVFTAPADIMTVGSVNFSAGSTFNANGGTLDFTGNSSSSACASAVFNQVTFHNTATKTIGSDCTLPLGNNPTIANSVTLNGTLSGTGTISTTTGTLTIGTTGVLSGFSGINTTTALTVNGTLNASTYSTFTIGSTLTLGAASVFTAPSGTINLTGSLTVAAGATFNANGGTLNLTVGTGTLSCANVAFNLVTINGGTNIKTINSDCNLPLGNNPSITRVVLNGTLSGTGTLTHTSSTFQLNAGAALTGFTGYQDNTQLIIAGANFDASTYSSFIISSQFTMSSGTFTAPSSMSIGGAMNLSGGTFDANGGTVVFNTFTAASISCNNTVFNNVIISKSNTLTVGSDCSLPLGDNPSTTGSINLSGTLSGTGTLQTANTLTLLAGSNLSGFSGLSSSNLTITGATIDTSTYSTFTVSGTYSQTGGTVTMPTAGASFSDAFTLNTLSTFIASSGITSFGGALTLVAGATFNANGGIVNFNGTGGYITCGGQIFNNVTFNNTGLKTVAIDCDLPLGNDPIITSSIDLNGTLSGTGTLTIGTTTSEGLYVEDGVLAGFTGLQSNGYFSVGYSSLDMGSFSLLDVRGDFGVSNGATFTAPTATMSVGGDVVIYGSTFVANGGTLNINGGVAGQTITCDNTVFSNITIQNNGGIVDMSSDCILPLGNNPVISFGSLELSGTLTGTGTLTSDGTLMMYNCIFCGLTPTLSGFTGLNVYDDFVVFNANTDLGTYNTLDINGNFWVTQSGAFTATSANMMVGGNFTVDTGSTFDANGGTVILDGSNQAIQGTSFNNLTKIAASADTLTLPAGVTETILGTLILKGGDANNLLSLVSSDPGVTQWQIDAQGARTLQYLNVVDSNNINATTMVAYDSVNGGNNTNWQFTDTPIPPSPIPSPTEASKVINSVVSGTTYDSTDTSSSSQSVVDIALKPSENGTFDIAPPPPEQGIRWYWMLFGGFLLLLLLFLVTAFTTDRIENKKRQFAK